MRTELLSGLQSNTQHRAFSRRARIFDGGVGYRAKNKLGKNKKECTIARWIANECGMYKRRGLIDYNACAGVRRGERVSGDVVCLHSYYLDAVSRQGPHDIKFLEKKLGSHGRTRARTLHLTHGSTHPHPNHRTPDNINDRFPFNFIITST